MQIAEFDGSALRLASRIGTEPSYTNSIGVVLHETDNIGSVLVRWHDVNGLINALTHARDKHAAGESDGTVAAVLLQDHVANAPGDFS